MPATKQSSSDRLDQSVSITAEEMRLPGEARVKLEQGGHVVVTKYGKPHAALLSWETFALLGPMLELIEAGAVVPPEALMTEDDVTLLNELARDEHVAPSEEALITALLAETPEQERQRMARISARSKKASKKGTKGGA